MFVLPNPTSVMMNSEDEMVLYLILLVLKLKKDYLQSATP